MTRPAVLVTGGATRIGAQIVRRFAADGWHTIIHYRSSSDEAETLAATLPSAEIVQCDLNDGDAAVTMVHDLSARTENWRCLINSASVFDYDDRRMMDGALTQTAMQVNAVTPARMAQAYFGSAMAAQGARVINITDMKIENSNPDFFSYTMSKHALNATIGMMAKDMNSPNDKIYGIAPGAILASFDQQEDEVEISHKLNLLQRKTGADEIAEAALFLAGGHLRSGTTLYIDSGQHMLDQDRDVIYLAREAADI